MSLKAKLEAVIYAAEEPVTLNQLAALFAADALEWKAAQEAAAAEQMAEVAGVSPDADAADGVPSLPLIMQVAEEPASTDGVDAEPAPRPGDSEVPIAPEAETVAKTEADGPQTNEVVSIGEAAAYPSITVEREAAASEAAVGEAEASPTELAPAPADAESEAKRLARLRDREVKSVLKHLLDELMASSQADGRGVEIREIAGGYRMATKPECHDAVRLFVKSLKPALKLSLPALETLAVIAYKQPVTAPEVSEIRGVESAGVLGSLLARKLIATAGRKPVIGRPILYKTTKEFLLRFGLKDVSELPSMEEFEKMAATELEMEPEVVEADKAAEAAEAAAETADATVENAEQDRETVLESNSPGGEELAGTAENVNQAASPTAAESNASAPDPAAEFAMAASPNAAEPTQPESARVDAVPAESGAEGESEAHPDAQKSNQRREEGH